MALLADRVKETTTTTGTGTVSLAGAPAGFQSFNTAFANGSLVYYVIQGGAEWEIGIGTTGTGTLARTQVLQSSNADALVPFSAGVKDVFCSYVADRAVTTVDAATLTNKTIDDYTNSVGANKTHFRIKATGTISKGSVVKATGYNPGEQAIEVAVVTSATDLVLGISEQALTAGQFGMAVVIGELFDVNTNGFTVGNIIYSNGAGGFTETKPSSGLYQALGWIVRANASNGVIAVNVVAPLYVETSTNTANTSVLRDGSGNFAAGTITATLSGTATQVSNALTAGTYLTSGGTYNGSAARTFAVDATDANTASKVVARDASGNFSAGTITATLNGAAPAGSLSGTTLASGVTASSLTSVGTLSSLTVSGNLTVDTNTLYVDAANNRVGVGTASPGYTVDVVGSSSTALNLAAFSNTSSANNTTKTVSAVFRLADTVGAGKDVAYITAFPEGANVLTGGLAFSTRTGDANPTEKLRLDGPGNLGLGVTPSAWSASSRTMDIGAFTCFGQNTAGAALVAFNTFQNSAGTYTYKTTNPSARYDCGVNGTAVHAWYTAPSGTAGNAITFTQAMTLDASGNLAIGTDTPGTALGRVFRINGASSGTNTGLIFSNALTDNGTAYSSNTQFVLGSLSAIPTVFVTNNTERARIDASGNLGLGVTPTTASLPTFESEYALLTGRSECNIVSNAVFNSGFKYINAAAATRYQGNAGSHIWSRAASGSVGAAVTWLESALINASGFFKASNTGTYLGASGTYHEIRSDDAGEPSVAIQSTNASYTGTVTLIRASKAAGTTFNLLNAQSNLVDQFTVRGDGTVYAQNTTIQAISDARLKENIVDSTEGLDVIAAMRPVRYDWKPGHGNDRKHQLGFIAQEVEAVFPDAVSEWDMNGETYKTVGPAALIPVLVKAIQELTARVVALETN